MIIGSVTGDGECLIRLAIAGEEWDTIVDTGFNGHLELPPVLKRRLNAQPRGTQTSFLAAGVVVEEESFLMHVPIDGERIPAFVTFVSGSEILLGTGLLRRHRLEIDFSARTVRLERVA